MADETQAPIVLDSEAGWTLEELTDGLEALAETMITQLFSVENVVLLALGAAGLFISLILAKQVERQVNEHLVTLFATSKQTSLREALGSVVFPFVWLIVNSVLTSVIANVSEAEGSFFDGQHVAILSKVSVLILAWIIIRLSAGLVTSQFWGRAITIVVWVVTALNILGGWDETLEFLDLTLSFQLGNFRISALSVLKAIVLLSILLWLSVITSRWLDRKIRKSRTLTPSVQELTSKLMKILFITIAVVVSLTSMGLDLTALAVFSGALGVGIGFGLQKVVSNLLSGIILLLDRSIKPGDVIELQDTYGWINTLGARFVSVITRDGKEHLIPNEDLITQKVINWSYSDTNVRLKIPVGVSYDSDVNKAMDLLVEAAIETPRVLESPAPRCLMMGFGDNSVDLELRIWASDPNNGVANLKSAVLVKVWKKFHEHDISIPFPQRDVHLDINEESLAKFMRASGTPSAKATSKTATTAKRTRKPAAKSASKPAKAKS